MSGKPQYREKQYEWVRKNRARVNQISRNWAKRHPDRVRAAKARWKKKNPKYDTIWQNKNPKVWLFRRTRESARQQGLEFSLTLDWFREQMKTDACSITGIPFDYNYGTKTIHPFRPSVDRIKPERGYIPDNCRIVCLIYNFAKNIWTDADVARMADALVARSNPDMMRLLR